MKYRMKVGAAMSRLLKSQDYLMKCLGFVLLFGFISLGAIGGCSNNGGDNNNTQALTENDFSEDSSISAKADGGVVVNFLEPPGSAKPESDTGEVGIDVIPYRYNKTTENTFCWEDDDLSAAHFMTLVDSGEEEVLMLEVNRDCVTQVIERGNYEMRLHHDGMSEDTLAIFIQPILEEQLARNSDSKQGIIKTVKRIFEETLHNIGISTEARAQTLAQNVQTLLKTNSCVNCDLEQAELSKANLTGTNLSGANVAFANLSQANLFGANLSNSNLTNSNMTGVNLDGANLFMAVMETTNLTGANLGGANLKQANLLFAFLTGANLVEANLSGATWCNQCVCAAESIGQCVGCPSVDICTGPPAK